ncbi:MAG: holo-ACP synthase [Eubacteriales bacterium]|nr:holo-ACP synthase [Eubacteriales bacterium]
MSVYCGVDIVEVERLKDSIESMGSSFTDRIYTPGEVEYCEGRKNGKYQSYAARFAAKEAVSKAFGTGIGSAVGWKDIEIVNDENGKPSVILSGPAKESFAGINGVSVSISLSHCKSYAVAYAIIEVE